jgi:hypothetical protein
MENPRIAGTHAQQAILDGSWMPPNVDKVK